MGLVLAVALVSGAARARPPDPIAADALMEQFAQAWTRGDAARLAELLADDVTLVGEQPMHGRDAVLAWAKAHLAGSGKLVFKSERSGMSGWVTFQMGRWTLEDKSGKSIAGNHTFVFRRYQDGVWRIIAMHVDPDPPAPAK